MAPLSHGHKGDMHVDAQPTAVQAHLEAKVMTVRRELSAEYRRRLDALEAEWAKRASSRASELETAHTLKLQQVRCRASCRTSTTKGGHLRACILGLCSTALACVTWWRLTLLWVVSRSLSSPAGWSVNAWRSA